ncbi:MAG TPA: PPC domain-containing protein [Thermoanaerobaculia bacterium]|nr:PPC domain-containing protein [Thermoanaerobaculia bacterium]
MKLRRFSPSLLLCLLGTALSAVPAMAAHHCFPEPLRCGETRRASLDASECFLDEESWADFYTFTGPAGQNVTITLTSDNFTPSLFLFNPQPQLVDEQNGSGNTLTLQHTLERGGLWRIGATTVAPRDLGLYTISLQCSTPTPPTGNWLTTNQIPGFRFKVRITAGSQSIAGAKVNDCLEDTLCVSGAIRDRAEVFIRVVGPRPNGLLWPTMVKLNTSQVEIWIEQEDTGEVRYYFLPGADPSSSELPGFFDRNGFQP